MVESLVLMVVLLSGAYLLAKKLSPRWRTVPVTVALALSFGLTAFSLTAFGAGKDTGKNKDKEKLSKNLVIITSEKQFRKDVLNSELPVVVDFYADWCPPCQQMLPVMNKLADEWKGKVKFVKVSIDDMAPMAQAYEVRGIPDVRIMVKGKEKGKYVGFRDYDEWTKILKDVTK
ncbi:MAG: thioredoxin domain-containing protein [Victivallales bacterium]|nr:thioredoxin domain-containing protein [Victivallales bacterium]